MGGFVARFDKGWLKLWRKSAFSDLGQNWTLYGAWNCLLVIANIQPSDCIWNGKRRKIERGQILTSYTELAELGEVNRKTATKWIEYLKERQSISIERGSRGSMKGMIITILNYQKYQENTSDTEETDLFDRNPSSLKGQSDGQSDGQRHGHWDGHIIENKRIKEEEEVATSENFKITPNSSELHNAVFDSETVKIKNFLDQKPLMKDLAVYAPHFQFRFKTLEIFNLFYEGLKTNKGFLNIPQSDETTRVKYIKSVLKTEIGLIKKEVRA